jgi:hypothetical protein
MKYRVYKICTSSELKDVWYEDEELRTITCVDEDPVCDHCFDLCRSISRGEIFRPRYSHKGIRKKKRNDPDPSIPEELIEGIAASQKFMDGWRGYMIP